MSVCFPAVCMLTFPCQANPGMRQMLVKPGGLPASHNLGATMPDSLDTSKFLWGPPHRDLKLDGINPVFSLLIQKLEQYLLLCWVYIGFFEFFPVCTSRWFSLCKISILRWDIQVSAWMWLKRPILLLQITQCAIAYAEKGGKLAESQ